MITPHVQQCPRHQVYTCLPGRVYVGGETAPSTVIILEHLSESVCVLYVKPVKACLAFEGLSIIMGGHMTVA